MALSNLLFNVNRLVLLGKAASDYWDGCLMAIDGWVCQTRKPTKDEVFDVNKFRNRYGIWGFVVLAGCDAKTKFCMWSCVSSGSTNDIVAWNHSKLKQEYYDKGKIPPKYFFIGDEAFSCNEQFLVPYGGKGIGSAKDSFNYQLSLRRQVIERSLKKREWFVHCMQWLIPRHRELFIYACLLTLLIYYFLCLVLYMFTYYV